jgi:hypothetical protein
VQGPSDREDEPDGKAEGSPLGSSGGRDGPRIIFTARETRVKMNSASMNHRGPESKYGPKGIGFPFALSAIVMRKGITRK